MTKHTTNEEWRALCARLGGDDDATAVKVFELLQSKYREPHRKYHNIDHIDACLSTAVEFHAQAEGLDEVLMAIWLHDVIYDTHAADNEARSAAFARTHLQRSGVDEGAIGRVADLVLATRHDEAPTTQDAHLIVDIDLSTLGAPPDAYDVYERSIRQEYDWVDPALYARERSKILRAFLERPSIYTLGPFAARYEAPARSNLQRAIEQLDN